MRAIGTIVRTILGLVRGIAGIAMLIVRLLVGEVSWRAPGWMLALGDGLASAGASVREHPRRAAGLGAVALGLGALLTAGVWWYQQRPRPEVLSFQVTQPPRTALEEDGARPQPLVVSFDGSAAKLDLAGKEITPGLAIQPALEGRWQWVDDKVLHFVPKNDWPVGAEFKVTLEARVLRENVRLAADRLTFKTAPFEARIAEAQFHQDPQNATAKRIVATVNFSHPVDAAEFERRIVLRQKGQSAGFLGIGGESTKFKVSYDKQKLNAYIHSEPLPIPAKHTYADLTIDAGVRSARGGPATIAALANSITIPGLYSLRVRNVLLSYADNERHEPDRVLIVNLSADTPEREMQKSVAAWVLPVHHPDTKPEERKAPHRWNDPTKIGPEILREATPLKLTANPAERDAIDSHSFKFDANAERYVYVKVAKNVKSFGGYVLEKDHDGILRVERFPRQLKILANGSLLALSGERKLAVMARDVEGLRFEIGRVLPQQLQHLVTQSNGTFAAPQFGGSFDEGSIVERFTQVQELAPGKVGKPSYHAIDLGQYLEGDARRGVFFVKVESYDARNKRTTGARDARFVVVTDLGLLAKRSADGTHDVFVQSIANGQAVAGVAVDIVGRNGVTLLSQTSDATGRARFGDLAAYTRERQPAMIVARKGNDSAFLPIGRNDRTLELSRFDVGGVENVVEPGKLSAYLFSDRGIYRPGDEIRFGMIVRTADWSRKLAGLPLELALADPRGVVIRREKLKVTPSGFDELRHSTQDVSPTGNYTLTLHTVKDGLPAGEIGAVQVKVQEFLPDRLKMSVRLSSESPAGWVSPDQLKARVNLQNLFGTPAENRRVTASVTLSPQFPVFAGFGDYRFTDPHYAKEGFTEDLAETKTNERGEAEIDLGLARFAKATYRVQVLAQGFEADGGRGVTAGAVQLVSSMPFLVGYKADGDLSYVARGAQRAIELIAIDREARKIDAKDLTLVRVERKFVSVLTKQPNGTYKYESRKRETELDRQPLNIAVSGTKVALANDAPGAFTYVVRDNAGLDLARVDYNVAGAANLTRSLDKNAELQLTLNKRDYQPGEEIELNIVAPYMGAGLVTIERDRVYEHAWFKASTTASVQRIRLPKEFEGNGYVMVTFVRDPGSEEIYTSPLSYAVQPFSVALDRRKTKITVEAPQLVKPGETITFRHRADRPARAVVYAVDEGILQVARYQNPDPIDYFFQKRALGVQTSQILDLILPEFKRLVQAAAPGGGDASALDKNLNPFKRRRDRPVAYWSGIIDTGPAGGELKYTIPDSFNGTLRVIAVAATDATVGVHDGKTTVRGDFVLSPNLPTTVTPGDEFDISVGVSNNVIGSGKDAKVALTLATTNHLEIVGAPKVDVAAGELREASATFRLRAKETLGSAGVTFTASLQGKSGKSTTDISVRPANPYVVDLASGSVRDGKVDVGTTRDMHAELAKRELSISHLPTALAQGLASYLHAFPYSCTEQLVSMAMPALILVDRPELGRVVAPEGKTLADAVAMLRSRQNSEGGFGLWAANHYVVELVSVYAQHFLLEARERRQRVPDELIKHGNDYLRQLAGSEGDDLAAERARAYAIYLLTRQGVVTSNFAAALQKRLETNHQQTWRQDIAAAYLAAAYALMKQERAAERLIADVPFGQRRAFGRYYDGLTHDAQLLHLTSRHFPERAKKLPPDVLEGIVKAIAGGSYNTLSSSYTLLAIDAYAKVAAASTSARYGASEILKNGSVRALGLTEDLVSRVPFTAEASKIQLSVAGDLPAFYSVNQSGFDRALPTKEVKDGIEILREYLGRDGKPVKSVKVGEEIDVRLTFRALERGDIGDVAIVDLLPGGFELALEERAERDANRDENTQAGWKPAIGTSMADWSPDYADLREDRVVLYGTVGKDVKRFVYRIKATNTGTFAIPPAFAESMYERALRARSLGGRIVVEKK